MLSSTTVALASLPAIEPVSTALLSVMALEVVLPSSPVPTPVSVSSSPPQPARTSKLTASATRARNSGPRLPKLQPS